MCWFNNSALTTELVNKGNRAETIFKVWFDIMNRLDRRYEMRRVIFGLVAMLNSPKSAPPVFV